MAALNCWPTLCARCFTRQHQPGIATRPGADQGAADSPCNARRRPRRSARARDRAPIILSPPPGTPRLSCTRSATCHPCRAATARPHARAADAHANAQPLVRAGHPVRGTRGIRQIRPGDPCWVGADQAATAPLLIRKCALLLAITGPVIDNNRKVLFLAV